MFRERPLTWLFVIATICVDAMIVMNWEDPIANDWRWGLGLGQSAVLGYWLIAGTGHRLERAAMFVTGLLAITSVLVWPFQSGGLLPWGRMLTPSAIFGAMSAVGAAMEGICFSHMRKKSRDVPDGHPVRYSMMELIGWTAIVAISAASLRHVQMIQLLLIPEMLIFVVGFSFTLGIVTALLTKHRYEKRYSFGISLACIAAFHAFSRFVLSIGAILPLYEQAFSFSILYVAAWIVVRRLDAPLRAHTAPQTSTDDQTSLPQP